ncbi:MAG TPA: Na/Pi cotransporter family protein, partial [Xanthobacteraceae bacterium]|nr:Na/Pi cotransporter family protein [Xanthobacteraceae bacterium]
AALALVLGANLGSAINPLIEGGSRGDPATRRLPLGNLINRLFGVLIVLPFLAPLAKEMMAFQPNPTKMVAEFHMLFNVALAVIFLGALDGEAWLLRRLLPEKKQPDDAAAPRYLDDAALETPPLALANAARETLRMGDTVEAMLRDVMTALMTNDRKLLSEVERRDDIVDKLNEAIKLYITKLTRDSLDDREGRRAMEIISFTINLEHIGDIIDKNLCELAAKKIKRRYQFSPEGAAELTGFHKRVCECLQAAFGIFMTGDVVAARKLLQEKSELRRAELAAADRHFDRLREGRPESLETTSLHLDVLSDLKRIHSHICSVAYPVLQAAGELPVREAAPADTTTDALSYQPKLP